MFEHCTVREYMRSNRIAMALRRADHLLMHTRSSNASWDRCHVPARTIPLAPCIEARLTATEEQVSELRISFSVQADYLTIEHCAFGAALQWKREIEVGE